MDSNSYNSIHIVTESVIMGAVSMYFYKKISDLETIVKDLQQQVVELKAQSATSRRPPYERAEQSSPQKTLLRIPTPPSQGYSLPAQDPGFGQLVGQRVSDDRRSGSRIPEERRTSQSDERRPLDAFGVCSDGVCKLVSDGKKVVISKISKQAEFDRESFQVNHPLKVETFKRTSPNPIIKSVTPKPSESISETVEQILNEINNE